ncbi:hypothetical protein DESC_40029 [Desulfosarcina cetonica]|nr:hypothetical protein DESC_40029 [Desulfosarcina cetonica]
MADFSQLETGDHFYFSAKHIFCCVFSAHYTFSKISHPKLTIFRAPNPHRMPGQRSGIPKTSPATRLARGR